MTDQEQHDRKLSGYHREVHENIIAAALCKMQGSTKQIYPSDMELLMAKLRDMLKDINISWLEEQKNKMIISSPDPADTANQMAGQLLSKFSSFSKDELLWVLTMIHVEMLVYKICGTTGSAKIVKS